MIDARDLVDLASDAAFAVNQNLQVIAWNDRARALLGCPAREVLGRGCCEVGQAVLPGGEPLCTPGCEGGACFAHGRPFAVRSCRARHRQGRWVRVRISTLVVPAKLQAGLDGSPVAVVLLRPESGAAHEASIDRPVRIFAFGRFGLAVGGAVSRSRDGNASKRSLSSNTSSPTSDIPSIKNRFSSACGPRPM